MSSLLGPFSVNRGFPVWPMFGQGCPSPSLVKTSPKGYAVVCRSCGQVRQCRHDPLNARPEVLVVNRGRLVLDGLFTEALNAMRHVSYPDLTELCFLAPSSPQCPLEPKPGRFSRRAMCSGILPLWIYGSAGGHGVSVHGLVPYGGAASMGSEPRDVPRPLRHGVAAASAGQSRAPPPRLCDVAGRRKEKQMQVGFLGRHGRRWAEPPKDSWETRRSEQQKWLGGKRAIGPLN